MIKKQREAAKLRESTNSGKPMSVHHHPKNLRQSFLVQSATDSSELRLVLNHSLKNTKSNSTAVIRLNLFMPSGLFYLDSLDRSISCIRDIG